MKLKKWVENKKNELIKSNQYKTVVLSSIDNVEIEKNITSEILDFRMVKEISINTEVCDFVRSELTEKIKGLKITFDVVKSRCRKSESLYLYVKII